MFFEILGFLSAAAAPATAAASVGSLVTKASDTIEKKYVEEVRKAEEKIKQEFGDLGDVDDGVVYATHLQYMPDVAAKLGLGTQTELFVYWTDAELGKYARIEGNIRSGMCDTPEAKKELVALVRKGEKMREMKHKADNNAQT